MKRTTITDIATLTGLSKASVSKAVNGRPGVSAATRERVLQVAAQLGWRPNARAVALTRGGAGAVGLLVNRPPDFLGVDPYFFDLMTGIQRTLGQYGYWVLLGIESQMHRDEEISAYQVLGESQQVDGVFLTDTRLGDPRLDAVSKFELPTVIVSRPWTDTGLRWVGSPKPGGGIGDAVAHLATLGHRKVAYVSGPHDRSHVMFRNEAFLTAVSEHGLSVVGFPRTDFSPAEGAAATLGLLDQAEAPTAIIYDNDIMALAGIRAATGRGLRVPEDLSVIGHDDISIGEWLGPPLTTVGQDVVLLGERCALALLMEVGVVVDTPADGWDRLADPALVVRESTGPTAALR